MRAKVRLVLPVMLALLVAGCAHFRHTENTEDDSSSFFGGTSLLVDQKSSARQVLDAVPAESAMERFEMMDGQGRVITYIAFTDTEVGGLVFVNQQLRGMLSHQEARAFYSCRGYVTATSRHWALNANEWGESLLNASVPVDKIKLTFSGKSTTQSIKEVVDTPMLGSLKSLLSIGSNPLSLFRSLDNMRTNIETRDQFEKALKGLTNITPGMSEVSVAGVINPEDVAFSSGGLVMAYPKYLIEYFVTDGVVRVVQQPSFYYLSRTKAALFYTASTQWQMCTPGQWKRALPLPQGIKMTAQ